MAQAPPIEVVASDGFAPPTGLIPVTAMWREAQ